jgi:hypothetical protein
MITASGAEGINLKNTRYVHLVEPYWHMVRFQQVVGRARRICSHEDLPVELHTIKVFVYLSVLSETQKTNKSYLDLLRIDKSRYSENKTVTTDEYLFESAEKKDNINQTILNAVKSSAIDCKLFNKGSENYLCYNIQGVNNDFLTLPDIAMDEKYSDSGNNGNYREIIQMQLTKITVKGVDYYMNEATKDFYSVDDYKRGIAINDFTNILPLGKLVKKKEEDGFEMEFYKQ